MTTEQINGEIAIEQAYMVMWKHDMEQSEIDWKHARIAELRAKRKKRHFFLALTGKKF